MTEQETDRNVGVCPLAAAGNPGYGLPYDQEDEINLIDYVLVLLRNKWLIFWIVFIAGAGAVAISLMMTNIYQSSATIVPKGDKDGRSGLLQGLGGLGGMVADQMGLGGSGSLEKLEVLLKSRHLSDRVVTKHNLLPVIFEDIWNETESKWETDEPPTLEDAYRALKGALGVKAERNGTLALQFKAPDPERAKKMVSWYLDELSALMREEVLQEARENKRFFQEQLDQTADPLLREKISALMAAEIEKETFAQAQKYYGFVVVDPPVVPEQKVAPKRALNCILSVVVAFFLAVFAAFFKEYAGRLKREDPERYQEVVQGLKFWKRKKAPA